MRIASRRVKMGSYSATLVVIVLAIVVAVNVLVQSVPVKYIQCDISSQRLFSVTSNTKVVVNNLQEDVTIYWIVQKGKEDEILERLLQVYDSQSDKLTVERKDPDIYPTFASQYTKDSVANNSLVVVKGDKYRFIGFKDIYKQEMSKDYRQSATYSFDGEGQITSAINYVVAKELPQIYLTSGHGEKEISESFRKALNRANIETQTFSLLNVDKVPENASVVMVSAPSSDISKEEAKLMIDYVKAGGKLMVVSGPQQEDEMTNLKSVLEAYGVTFAKGIVIEGDREHYGFSYPYILIPTLQEDDITGKLIEEKKIVLVPMASGLVVENTAPGVVVKSLLNTSDSSFSKTAGYNMSTAEKEDGDVDGGFSVALSIEQGDGKAVWISSDAILDDQIVAYSAGANTDFVMNAMSQMIGDNTGVAIASKSMSYNYLTINDSQANLIRILLIGVFPLIYIALGISELLERRKKL